MSLDFDITDLPSDAVPPADDVEYPCVVCGKEAGPYAGKGRKPTKCPEHKRGGATTKSALKTTGSNKLIAGQAADALSQMNAMLAVAAMVVQMPGTATAISLGNEAFREQAYEALITDPALCRTILRGGAAGGKAALLIAYAMFLTPVGITAKGELDAKKVGREESTE